MLQLYSRHDFYNIIFKMKRKLYIASGSAPPSTMKNSGCARRPTYTRKYIFCTDKDWHILVQLLTQVFTACGFRNRKGV
jgi:hypothetical protein